MTVSSIAPAGAPHLVAAASASSSASATNTAPGSTPTLGYNAFISILIAELQHQDPTQPMDPSQMVTQLATISEVGQAVQTNTNLSSLLTATSLSQAEQLIGKTVTSSDGSVSGQVSSVTVSSSGTIATLSNGQQVPLTNGVTVGP